MIKDTEKKRKYMRKYMGAWRGRNRDHYNTSHRDWCAKNKKKVKAIRERYAQKCREQGIGKE